MQQGEDAVFKERGTGNRFGERCCRFREDDSRERVGLRRNTRRESRLRAVRSSDSRAAAGWQGPRELQTQRFGAAAFKHAGT